MHLIGDYEIKWDLFYSISAARKTFVVFSHSFKKFYVWLRKSLKNFNLRLLFFSSLLSREVPWLSSHDILRFLTVTHVPVCWSVSCRVILKLWHSVQWSDWLDNLINAVPFASSMPEVVSISKYWKSNLEFYCSKTAFLSQSQPVNLQTIFHISVVRICKIQSWMYFCCQSEGRLYWPQVCRISFATRSVPT